MADTMETADRATEKKIEALVDVFETKMAGLETLLAKATAGLSKGSLDPGKARTAAAKVRKVMEEGRKVAALASGPLYDRLSPQGRSDLDWVEQTMHHLLGVKRALDAAAKAEKYDPAKMRMELAKASAKALDASAGFKAPSGVGSIVKMMKRGIDLGGWGGAGVAFLPTIIVLFVIYQVVVQGRKARPGR